MIAKGIKISDKIDHLLTPTLLDILEEINNGSSYYWSILFLDGMPNRGQGEFFSKYVDQANESKDGLLIKWKEFDFFSKVFFQIWDAIILGSKDSKLLRRYEEEEDMYTRCDFVIELIDCTCWEVYSKDEGFLDRLKKKFRDVEVLTDE